MTVCQEIIQMCEEGVKNSKGEKSCGSLGTSNKRHHRGRLSFTQFSFEIVEHARGDNSFFNNCIFSFPYRSTSVAVCNLGKEECFFLFLRGFFIWWRMDARFELELWIIHAIWWTVMSGISSQTFTVGPLLLLSDMSVVNELQLLLFLQLLTDDEEIFLFLWLFFFE